MKQFWMFLDIRDISELLCSRYTQFGTHPLPFDTLVEAWITYKVLKLIFYAHQGFIIILYD